MSIQFKSIAELRGMLDEKLISVSELTEETFLLAKRYQELNCFVTMNEESSAKKATTETTAEVVEETKAEAAPETKTETKKEEGNEEEKKD